LFVASLLTPAAALGPALFISPGFSLGDKETFASMGAQNPARLQLPAEPFERPFQILSRFVYDVRHMLLTSLFNYALTTFL
jgi:hypothetical protein